MTKTKSSKPDYVSLIKCVDIHTRIYIPRPSPQHTPTHTHTITRLSLSPLTQHTPTHRHAITRLSISISLRPNPNSQPPHTRGLVVCACALRGLGHHAVGRHRHVRAAWRAGANQWHASRIARSSCPAHARREWPEVARVRERRRANGSSSQARGLSGGNRGERY